jgi:exportin-1
MIATKTPLVRALRLVKKDILRLIQGYVQVCHDFEVCVVNFIPLLLDAILCDYRQNIEQARDAEVLSLTAEIIGRFGALMTKQVAAILDAVFECTLNMINKDFIEYPEHRVNFFALLAAINGHCFPALMQLGPLHFKLIVDSCVWAFKHTHREIADAGLKICFELLRNVSQASGESANAAWSDAFHAAFLVPLFTDIFYVLTDGEHKSGFRYHAAILAYLFEMLGQVRVSLSSSKDVSNAVYIREYLGNLLHAAFPHLQRVQLETFLKGLFELHHDLPTFKAHLRDFLVSLKEFSAEEGELFLEEQELEAERKREADREAARMIPGMIKPIEIEEDSD